MIFDSMGLVQDNGASDWADSARLAGLMALFDHPNAPDCSKYFVKTENGFFPVRHPTQTKYPENEPRCMSGDQIACLSAGLWKQGYITKARRIYDLCGWWAPNNMNEKTKKWKVPDFIQPNMKNHLALCAHRKGFWFGYKWLEWSIKMNAKFSPFREPNQLIAMCSIAGLEYLKMYKSSCDWKLAIKLYWASSYRKESDWADFMINQMETVK